MTTARELREADPKLLVDMFTELQRSSLAPDHAADSAHDGVVAYPAVHAVIEDIVQEGARAGMSHEFMTGVSLGSTIMAQLFIRMLELEELKSL